MFDWPTDWLIVKKDHIHPYDQYSFSKKVKEYIIVLL